jgi:predicted 2-oxoglutarate/Fe(II)-dependent dioxygenase YbiX
MPHALIPDDAFPPGRNEPCYCGTGRRFKHCCGVRSATRRPPHGVGVVEGFLSPEACRELVSMFDAAQGERFKVRDRANALAVTFDDTRVAERVILGESQRLLDDVVARAFEEQIIPRTGQSIDWYEEPQLLRYYPGGSYLYHSDAYDYVIERGAWRKAVDRDVSLLLYLNDDYAGGALEFKRLSFTLEPRAGMLVWFPSDIRYEHMAKLVTHGRRYAIVSWAAASGVERVQRERANRSICWQTRAKKPAS